MRNSLSGDESLFSSIALGDTSNVLYDALKTNPNQQVSTDSLDMSLIDTERLRAVCAANKRDYCLTFSKMSESGLLTNGPTICIYIFYLCLF